MTLLTGAYVNKLTTNATGTEIEGVEVEFEGGKRRETYTRQHRGGRLRGYQLRRATLAQRQ